MRRGGPPDDHSPPTLIMKAVRCSGQFVAAAITSWSLLKASITLRASGSITGRDQKYARNPKISDSEPLILVWGQSGCCCFLVHFISSVSLRYPSHQRRFRLFARVGNEDKCNVSFLVTASIILYLFFSVPEHFVAHKICMLKKIDICLAFTFHNLQT